MLHNSLDVQNNRDSWSKRGDKCSDSGYVLEMEQTRFTDMGMTGKKREREREKWGGFEDLGPEKLQ